MSLVDVIYLKGTPVFTVPAENPNIARAHGAVLEEGGTRWLLPAYPPFGGLVAKDLQKIDKSLKWSPEATAHLDYVNSVPELIAQKKLPAEFQFHTKPFDHQVEGLLYLLHHPRFALFWDMGAGKSKVIIDLKRALPASRMLIITPPVTVRNWVREFSRHSTGTSIAAIDGTPGRKRKIIEEYQQYDVLVTSYGTARTMGLPRLDKKALAVIQTARASGKTISDATLKDLIRGIRSIGNTERQVHYANMWVAGAPVAQVVREAREEGGKRAYWLEDIAYDIIVADESHNIKDSGSQQTKTLLALSRKAPRRYLMSGTPTLGDPRHLYPQMKFLSPAIFPEDWFKFSDQFLVRSPYNKRIVTGFKNLNILNNRVQRVAIRKRKEECLDLPERQIIDVPFQLTAEQQKLYNTLVSAMGADLRAFFQNPNGTNLEIQNAAVLLNKLTQVSSGFVLDAQKKADICNGCVHLSKCVSENVQPYTRGCQVAPDAPTTEANFLKQNPKLEVLEELLTGILAEPQNKVIIWGVHRAELNLIAECLEKLRVGYVKVDGSNTSRVHQLIERFNDTAECRVYLGQIATGIGITLNAAAYTIYSSLDWSLGTYLQSIDRNYRAGQTKKVTVYRILGEGTVDQFKATALDEKKDISALLTNKIACATCEKRVECLKNGIELFDPGCLYKRNVKRTIAKAEVIS